MASVEERRAAIEATLGMKQHYRLARLEEGQLELRAGIVEITAMLRTLIDKNGTG